jgi:hypothetical protein
MSNVKGRLLLHKNDGHFLPEHATLLISHPMFLAGRLVVSRHTRTDDHKS